MIQLFKLKSSYLVVDDPTVITHVVFVEQEEYLQNAAEHCSSTAGSKSMQNTYSRLK